MNKLFLVLLILLLYACSERSIEEKQNEEHHTEVKNSEASEPPSKVFAKTFYDIDRNGKQDIFTIKGTYDVDTLEVFLNDKKYTFRSRCSDFTAFDDSIVLQRKLVRDKSFVFIDAEDKRFLLIKDKGDFAGPCYSIFGISGNEFKEVWHTQNELTDIRDLDHDEINEVIVHELIYDPASKGRYTYVNYPLYLVYKYSEGIFEKEEELTKVYNLTHNINFGEYLKMKEPVLGWRSDSNSHQPILIDLDTIKLRQE